MNCHKGTPVYNRVLIYFTLILFQITTYKTMMKETYPFQEFFAQLLCAPPQFNELFSNLNLCKKSAMV